MKYGKLINNEIEYFVPYKGGLRTGKYIIINPTDEQFAEEGYYPVEDIYEDGSDEFIDGIIKHYVGSSLSRLKEQKLQEISNYDISDNVNGFYLGDMLLWIPRETRVSLQNSTAILLKNGIETASLWEGTMHFELPCTLLLQILDSIEIYALQCFNKTAEHKANVMNLNSIEEIEAYDYTQGYPEKLQFNL